MPHIQLAEGLPGIRSLFAFRPETAKPLCELADELLHAPGTQTGNERELIATCVSSRNDCHYCPTTHGAIAARHLGGNETLMLDVKWDFERAGIPDKLKALLNISGKVQSSGRNVQPEDIERAREQGAIDQEVHDTVLIAPAFCMYNRYVDGLATGAPPDIPDYRERAAHVAEHGYLGIPQAVQAHLTR
jgi:uncharacterized peroxidase-related enzyme